MLIVEEVNAHYEEMVDTMLNLALEEERGARGDLASRLFSTALLNAAYDEWVEWVTARAHTEPPPDETDPQHSYI